MTDKLDLCSKGGQGGPAKVGLAGLAKLGLVGLASPVSQ